jgi:hypothetical protein
MEKLYKQVYGYLSLTVSLINLFSSHSEKNSNGEGKSILPV